MFTITFKPLTSTEIGTFMLEFFKNRATKATICGNPQIVGENSLKVANIHSKRELTYAIGIARSINESVKYKMMQK